jgi:hypothetical protein
MAQRASAAYVAPCRFRDMEVDGNAMLQNRGIMLNQEWNSLKLSVQRYHSPTVPASVARPSE